MAGTFGKIIKPQRLMHVPVWKGRLNKSGGVSLLIHRSMAGPHTILED